MAIDLATKFSPLVDETFTSESRTSLVTNNDYDFVGSHSIKIYSVGTASMNDYARNTTGLNRYGTPSDLTAEATEFAMEKDRSFTFVIDAMDEDETLGALNAGTALARQISEVVIPEVDLYTYGKMVSGAGKVRYSIDLTQQGTSAYDVLTDADEYQDDKKVPQEGRVLICNPAFYKGLKKDERFILDSEIGQTMRIRGVVGEADGVLVQKVPSSVLPANTLFILAHPVATTQAIKLAEYKIHTNAPGVSGSLVEGRLYYTAFVRPNKKEAIYVGKTSASV